MAVFATFNGVDVGADEFDVVFGQYAIFMQGDRRVQRGLATQGGQECVGALFSDDLFDHLWSDRLDVRGISKLRVGHDRGRIAVDQNDANPLGPKDATGLSARVIKFAGLTNHDGAGPDDHHAGNVRALRHGLPPLR